MFCPNCGKEIEHNEHFCNACGSYLLPRSLCSNQNVPMQPVYNGINNVDKESIGLNILSFFLPIVGLILYLVWKDEYPKKAKGCGKAAFISAVVLFVLPFFMIFVSVFLVAIM